jgi:hypothetical protein
MSDAAHRVSFLGGLVDRALGLEPVLQPRKASLFEPQAGADVAEPFGESAAGESAAAAAMSVRATAPPADRPAPGMYNAPQAAIEIPLKSETHASRVAELVPREIAAREEPAQQRATAALLPLAAPSHIATHIETFSHRNEVSRRVDHLVERSVEYVRDGAVRPSRDEPPQRRALEPRSEFVAEPVKPRREPPAPVSAALLAQPIAQDLIAPRAEAPERRAPVVPMPELSAPQGPVVNVTIGRVEVRAHSAPGRGGTDRRGAKPMSLDDYLKRQSGP